MSSIKIPVPKVPFNVKKITSDQLTEECNAFKEKEVAK